MSKSVIWSPLAENDLENILEYLNKEWPGKVCIEFLELIEKLLIKIAENPRLFPLVNKKRKVRKCVITKHNTLFYRDKKGFVEVLRIFDTRQSPKKKKYE